VKPIALLLQIPLLAVPGGNVSAQIPAKQTALIQLANTPTEKGLNDLSMMLTLIAGVRYVSSGPAQSMFAMTGYPDQLSLAEWLMHAVDKPPGWQVSDAEYHDPASRQYVLQEQTDRRLLPFPNYQDRTIRVFYMRNAYTWQALVEAQTHLRIVVGIQMVFTLDRSPIIVYRTAAQLADVVEWYLQRLDIPADGRAFAVQQQNHTIATFQVPGAADDLLRIYYLKPETPVQEMTKLLAELRDDLHVTKSFGYRARSAIAVRGTSAQLARFERLLPVE
jgi:hypothetical protein